MATPSSTHLFSLPEEAIDIICQQFCPYCSENPSPRYFFLRSKWPNPTDGRNCLLALSLTCQELRRISKPHLYHRPTGHDFYGFINTIDETPALGRHLKELYVSEEVTLSLRLQHDEKNRNGRYHTGMWPLLFFYAFDNLIPALISATPMFNKLEIHVENDGQFPSTLPGCLPNLEELTIIFASRYSQLDDDDGLASLLRAAPRLERTELFNFKTPKASFRHDTVNEITLRSSIIRISRMDAIMLGFPRLQTFRMSAPRNLQRIHYTSSQQTSLSYKIEDLLMLRSDTLKHLTLDFPGIQLDYQDEIVIQDLSQMEVLETLYIDSGMLHRRWKDRQPAPRFCHMLPKSFKEFGLMGSAYSPVHEEVVESINISAQTFPHLKKVFVSQFQEEWPDDGVEWESRYASACEAHNIELLSWLPPSLQRFVSWDPYWE
ncbi:aromatic aminotransferase [Fusarium pseudocircinatum]|uniref:Aromatic aminotransferase n=1 Tax=Fusarium pseudocircinatum TaxID=56676 RepID=A0A8H5L0S6_9HYPO|nr:aromatic aminotransferase [Fusarium pseudocircinatum]